MGVTQVATVWKTEYQGCQHNQQNKDSLCHRGKKTCKHMEDLMMMTETCEMKKMRKIRAGDWGLKDYAKNGSLWSVQKTWEACGRELLPQQEVLGHWFQDFLINFYSLLFIWVIWINFSNTVHIKTQIGMYG